MLRAAGTHRPRQSRAEPRSLREPRVPQRRPSGPRAMTPASPGTAPCPGTATAATSSAATQGPALGTIRGCSPARGRGLAPTLPGHRDHGPGDHGHSDHRHSDHEPGTSGQSSWAVPAQYKQPLSPPGVCGTTDPMQRARNNGEGTTFLFEKPLYAVPNKNS